MCPYKKINTCFVFKKGMKTTQHFLRKLSVAAILIKQNLVTVVSTELQIHAKQKHGAYRGHMRV